jgi:hypothetical protein
VWEDMLKGRQKTSEEELKKRYDLELRVGSDGLKRGGGGRDETTAQIDGQRRHHHLCWQQVSFFLLLLFFILKQTSLPPR